MNKSGKSLSRFIKSLSILIAQCDVTTKPDRADSKPRLAIHPQGHFYKTYHFHNFLVVAIEKGGGGARKALQHTERQVAQSM